MMDASGLIINIIKPISDGSSFSSLASLPLKVHK
jgi:hypothetical protein